MEYFLRMRFDKSRRNITVQVLINLSQSAVVKMELLLFIFAASVSYITIQVRIREIYYLWILLKIEIGLDRTDGCIA